MPDFLAELRRAGYAGEVGLLVTDFAGRELYAQAADAVFPAASTIKVPLLLFALEQAGRGDLDLIERVTLRAEDRVPGAGVLHELGLGLALTWQDVLTLMIVVSDNTATNLLIERLGQDHFNLWLTARGLNSTRLIGPLQLPPERQNEAQRRGERNRTTARDQVALLLSLLRGDGLTPQMQHLALDILSRQHLRDLIGRGVPAGPDGEPLYRVASKSGELRGVHHDVGLLWAPRPLVVALLSQGGEDPREHPGNRDVTRLSAALWPLLAELGETETP
ncbi:serine hydrolase [Deinococcus radiodurans]|jgi:Beta-lactamase class A|nr:serine hydrolase [Deinococcus radiodurans]ANC72317.1 serine hydrolase [Deinococcus radiodurans R1 = ATCC 13939 = DSM 20539]QIP28615.1 serine hydrolase [Deinococcus radiodurans]UID69437.1 serine hydrolase [Deinococcus radiodurans R1 = ATCC 13939 = DSM 20539]